MGILDEMMGGPKAAQMLESKFGKRMEEAADAARETAKTNKDLMAHIDKLCSHIDRLIVALDESRKR